MFIVQFNVAATASERPIAPPSAWRIPPVEDTIESVADDLLEGQYNNPVRVIGFDSADRTSRDVSEEVARSYGNAAWSNSASHRNSCTNSLVAVSAPAR